MYVIFNLIYSEPVKMHYVFLSFFWQGWRDARHEPKNGLVGMEFLWWELQSMASVLAPFAREWVNDDNDDNDDDNDDDEGSLAS